MHPTNYLSSSNYFYVDYMGWVKENEYEDMLKPCHSVNSLVVQGLGVSAPTPKAQGLISVQERRFCKWFVMALSEI